MHDEPNSGAASAVTAWRWPAAFVIVGLALILAGVHLFESCRRLPGEALDRAGQVAVRVGEEAVKVASAFRQGTITTTFTSYATTISGSEFLQFATLHQTELFTRRDESSIAFGLVPLPDLIVQASAPVTYTYYLDLDGAWDFRIEGGVIQVVAPLIQFNPPAVDASQITYEVKRDSLLRDRDEAMRHLRESITSLAYLKARANISLVRETGRHRVEDFIAHWAAKSFSDGQAYTVKVRFRNERPPGEAKRLATPGGESKVTP